MRMLKRVPVRRLALPWLYLLSAGYVSTMWLIDTRPYINLNGYERARFVDMVYGRTYKPFVLRALLPLVIRGLRALIPNHINYPMHGVIYARFPALYRVMLYLGWELEYLTEYALAALLLYASLLGTILALRAVLAHLGGQLLIGGAVLGALTAAFRCRAPAGWAPSRRLDMLARARYHGSRTATHSL